MNIQEIFYVDDQSTGGPVGSHFTRQIAYISLLSSHAKFTASSLSFSSVLPFQCERRAAKPRDETRETRVAAREEKETLPAQPEPMKYALAS